MNNSAVVFLLLSFGAILCPSSAFPIKYNLGNIEELLLGAPNVTTTEPPWPFVTNGTTAPPPPDQNFFSSPLVLVMLACGVMAFFGLIALVVLCSRARQQHVMAEFASRGITPEGPPRYNGPGSGSDVLQSVPVRLSASVFPAEYESWSDQVAPNANSIPELMVDQRDPASKTFSDKEQLIS